MPRVIEISVPSEVTDRLVAQLREIDGLIGLRVQRNISLQPPGDVVTIDASNRSLHAFMRLLQREGIGRDAGRSITTGDPLSIISPSAVEKIVRDTSEATWEEMEILVGKESNMTGNALLVMAISGVLAAIGISTNALHIVIGAMLIAPGFEPLARVSLGAVARSRAWQRGLADTLKAYAALVPGAVLATVCLRLLGKPPLPDEPSYLAAGVLISYWSSLTSTSLIASAAAAVAGAVLIATNRSVLTGGVMIALALVPSATLAAMALTAGEIGTGAAAALRWSIDAALVIVFSALVFAYKRKQVHQRDMLL